MQVTKYVFVDQPFEIPEGAPEPVRASIEALIQAGAVREYKFPEKGQMYFYVAASGEVGSASFGSSPMYDRIRKAMGNVFQHKDDAKRWVEAARSSQ